MAEPTPEAWRALFNFLWRRVDQQARLDLIDMVLTGIPASLEATDG